MRLPAFVEIEQQLSSKRVEGLAAAVCRAYGALGCRGRMKKGARVGIAVGSRGIDNLPQIVGLMVDILRHAGARPFVLPAMGSHGGSTPEGQTALLESLGVTPESVGAPVRASMAVEEFGRTKSGTTVYASREAFKADGVILLNRIKQHTDFTGEYESGLVKMLVIGLGKREGAIAMHARGCASLRADIPEAAELLLSKLPILGGIALLENGYHQTAEVVGLRPEAILVEEKALLRRARRMAAHFPFPEIDLVVVDWIGKDVSGVGFDTHVIARRMIWGEREFPGSDIHVLAALDLTPGSHGNGLGLGLADLVTARLAKKIDWSAVHTNVLHTGFLNRAKMPLTLPNDRELLGTAMVALGRPDPARVRVVRVADTLQVGRMWVSEGLVPEARQNPKIRLLGRPAPLKFDGNGDLERLSRAGAASLWHVPVAR